ncbi:MAG: polysaccharide deacetylase family protein [Bacteroidota bacterium]
MFKHTLPSFLPLMIPSLTWKVQTNDKTVFLTFDDGPHPEVTPWVLQTLSAYNAKATFFCVGENVTRFQDIYDSILSQGHAAGNHTYNHVKGWITPNRQYYENVLRCAAVVGSKLFRPPYGRIGPLQIRELKKQGYKIIMWDILTRDFDAHVNIQRAIKATVDATQKGSIIVFHDSEKAKAQLQQILPEVLKQLSDKGFTFKQLS